MPKTVPIATEAAIASIADFLKSEELVRLKLDQVIPDPDQPRKEFDDLEQLAETIKAEGVLQPIVVRPANAGGEHVLVFGERRWRASKIAGAADVPAIVRDLSDEQIAAVQIMENVDRANLRPLEEADALARLVKSTGSTGAVAAMLRRPKSWVSRRIQIAKAPAFVREVASSGACEDVNALTALSRLAAEDRDEAERVAAKLGDQDAAKRLPGGPRAFIEAQLAAAKGSAMAPAGADPAGGLVGGSRLPGCDEPAPRRGQATSQGRTRSPAAVAEQIELSKRADGSYLLDFDGRAHRVSAEQLRDLVAQAHKLLKRSD